MGRSCPLAGVQVADRLVAATSPHSSVAHAASRMVARVASRVPQGGERDGGCGPTRRRGPSTGWAPSCEALRRQNRRRTRVGSKSVDLIAMAQDIKTLRYGGGVNFRADRGRTGRAVGAKAEVAEVEAFHTFAQAHASANEVGVLPSAMVEQSIEEIVKAHRQRGGARRRSVGRRAVFSVALAAAAAKQARRDRGENRRKCSGPWRCRVGRSARWLPG